MTHNKLAPQAWFSALRGGKLSAGILLMVAALNTGPAQAAPPLSHDIHDYAIRNVQDFTMVLKTGRYNQDAGAKISKEFGMLYKLSGNGAFYYKAPNLIRANGVLAGMHGSFIMDGFVQRMRISFIHQNVNQSHAPGKITTLQDFGLINDFYLSYTVAQYQGEQTIDGVRCAMFRLSYPPQLKDTSFRTVWIDPATRTEVRREEHKQDGSLRAVYVYLRPVQIAPGFWLPSEEDAFNAQSQFVGQTFFTHPQANVGLSAKLFQ